MCISGAATFEALSSLEELPAIAFVEVSITFLLGTQRIERQLFCFRNMLVLWR